MANLDAYIDFNVTLNFQTKEITLTDTSSYPAGVNAGITGIVTIKQPDSIIIQGDWGTPDVTWTGSALTNAVKELRTTAQNTPQCGNYTITYEVIHASYTPTTLTRTFALNIIYPELVITDMFDVFTPVLTIQDDTVYDLSGFDSATVVRAWSIAVGSVTTITSSNSSVDLIYLGNYYDAVYTVTFNAESTQAHTTYTYLTVVYDLPFTGIFLANTPPPLNNLVQCLNDLKTLADAQADADCCSTLENKYGKAERRLSHLITMLRVGITDMAAELVNEFVHLTACAQNLHRNQPIQPYDISAYVQAGSDGDFYNYFLPSDLTEVDLPAITGKVVKSIDMDGFGRVFSVGLASDTPAEGRFIVVNASPLKLKYGGTMNEGQWLRIKYTNA